MEVNVGPVKKEYPILSAAVVPFFMVLLMWLVHLFSVEFDVRLSQYGLYPRTVKGLFGIITMPFLHGSMSHLLNNSAPMLVLGWMLFKFYKPIAVKTLLGIWLISGVWLWISGRESYHIGASGLVYGLAAFLFLSGLLRREKGVASLSFVVVFLYGSLWWGVLPVDPGISWEGHLWGGIAGLSLAIVYRKQGPQRRVYQWELEDDEEELPEVESPDQELQSPGHTRTVIYTYKPNPPKPEDES
jgi:membrane associated rhomboid family serine protease